MTTFGSVCSGIEAASSAWHPLGWRAEWFAEIEKFPAAVLAYHYPQVPNLGDMTKIAHRIRNGEIEAPDALVGGTPCQAFSLAGLRNSMADARGQLTLSYVDLANAIDSARHLRGKPACVLVWENVPGVLSTSDNAFGCFLAALAGEDRELLPPRDDRGRLLSWPNAGCVFGPQRTVAWRVLDAQYFGVAQRRRRVFVVASARKGFDPTTVLFEFDGVRRDTPPSRETGQDLAGTLASRTDGGGFSGTDEACSGYVQPIELIQGGELAWCLTTKTRIDAETETLIPTIGGGFVDTTATLDASYARLQGASGQDAGHGHSHLVPLSVALRGREGGAIAELGSSTPQSQSVAYSIRTANTSSNGWGIQEEVTHTIDSTQGPAVAYAIQAGALRVNPNSGPDGVGVQANIAYTMEARAEVQAVCITSDVTHTLKAEGFDASEDGTGCGQPIVPSLAFAQNTRDEVRLLGGDGEVVGALAAQPGMKQTTYVAPGGMAVRRLTPVECERLQSFPDGYTSIPTWNGWRAMGDDETPEGCTEQGLEVRQNKKTGKWRVKDVDGPRYKALGNSMCVYNMRWIGARIDAQLHALEFV